MDRRSSGRARLQRNRWRAGNGPARLRGARSWLGTHPQQHHAVLGCFRRQDETAAGGQIIIGKATFRFHQHGRDAAASHGIVAGAEHVDLTGRFDDGQLMRGKTKCGEAIAKKDQRQTGFARHMQGEDHAIPVPLPHGQGEGQRSRPVFPRTMDFVQPALFQQRDR